MKKLIITVFLLCIALQAFAVPKEIENALKLNRINHFDEALEVIETALLDEKIKPDVTSAYTIGRILYRKGELYREMSRVSVLTHLAHLKQIREREGELSGELKLFLGIGYFYNRQYLEAAGVLNQVAEAGGINAGLKSLSLVYLGASYYKTGEREKANELWKKIGREHQYAYASLGFLYAYLRINPSSAEMILGRVLESVDRLDPMYRESVQVYYAYALMSAGRFTDAYRAVEKVNLDTPIHVYRPDRQTEILFYDLAVVEVYSRILFGKAIENLEPVVTASSGELASFSSFYVAQMYLYLEDYDSCLKFSSRAQKLSVSSSLTMIRAVACESAVYYLQGRDKRGRRIITREIERIYGKPSYLLEMIRVLISSGVAYDEVSDVIEQVETHVFDAEWDRNRRDVALLGEVSFFSRQYPRALIYLEQARDKGNKNKIETNDPTFLLKLSFVYYNSEDYSESLEILFSLGKSFSGVRPLQDAVQSVYSYKQRGSGETLID
jgi:tetratricopeptide (TPR) repeat protein